MEYHNGVYNDKKWQKTSFEELLEIDSSVSIHDINLRALATEICSIYQSISPNTMNEIFTQWRLLRLQLMAFSYMIVAAKTTNLKDLRNSESASDFQQCLRIICKTKIGILRIATRNYFTFFYVISY